MSERTTYRVRGPLGFILATLLTVVCAVFLCAPTETALGQDVPRGDVPEGLFSLIHEANAAGSLVSTIEKDLSVVDRHPEAAPDVRDALRNTLELARVEFHELEKSVADMLSDYYNVDASKIATVRDSGKSWESIVAGLETGTLFDTPVHDGDEDGGSVMDIQGEVPPTTLVAGETAEDVEGTPSPEESGGDSWGYGLDRYAGGDGGNNNSYGSGGTGGGIGGVGGSGGVGGGGGVGSGSGGGGNNNSNNGIGWGVGGTSNAGGNSNNNNGNNGVGGGVGGGRDGNRGKGHK